MARSELSEADWLLALIDDFELALQSNFPKKHFVYPVGFDYLHVLLWEFARKCLGMRHVDDTDTAYLYLT